MIAELLINFLACSNTFANTLTPDFFTNLLLRHESGMPLVGLCKLRSITTAAILKTTQVLESNEGEDKRNAFHILVDNIPAAPCHQLQMVNISTAFLISFSFY